LGRKNVIIGKYQTWKLGRKNKFFEAILLQKCHLKFSCFQVQQVDLKMNLKLKIATANFTQPEPQMQQSRKFLLK
jgi:hypothetical protein